MLRNLGRFWTQFSAVLKVFFFFLEDVIYTARLGILAQTSCIGVCAKYSRNREPNVLQHVEMLRAFDSGFPTSHNPVKRSFKHVPLNFSIQQSPRKYGKSHFELRLLLLVKKHSMLDNGQMFLFEQKTLLLNIYLQLFQLS